MKLSKETTFSEFRELIKSLNQKQRIKRALKGIRSNGRPLEHVDISERDKKGLTYEYYITSGLVNTALMSTPFMLEFLMVKIAERIADSTKENGTGVFIRILQEVFGDVGDEHGKQAGQKI